MDAEHWGHVERLFQSAMDLPADERDAFLQRRCAGDEALEKSVQALLRSAGAAGSFLSEPAIETAAKDLARHQSAHLAAGERGPVGQTSPTIASSRSSVAAAWVSCSRRRTRGFIASSR